MRERDKTMRKKELRLKKKKLSYSITSSNKGVVIMAATNRPFDLDDAVNFVFKIFDNPLNCFQYILKQFKIYT